MRGKPLLDVRTQTSAAMSSTGMGLTAADYATIHEFLELQAGIRLGVGKEYLVTSRLGRVLRHFDLPDFSALAKRLGEVGARQLRVAVVDAMTTNETFWFRDPAHYRILTECVLPNLTPNGLRIWSAACSTGQEPYSLAMILADVKRGRAGGRCEIVGTDLSLSALTQAREARYCGMSASRGLSDAQRQRFFVQEDDCIEVRPEYKAGVSFREFNLLEPFDTLGRFDAVFCRNVLIYFSAERKRDILERVARVLNPGGYLFLGSTESMSSHDDLFEMQNVRGGLVYRRR